MGERRFHCWMGMVQDIMLALVNLTPLHVQACLSSLYLAIRQPLTECIAAANGNQIILSSLALQTRCGEHMADL